MLSIKMLLFVVLYVTQVAETTNPIIDKAVENFRQVSCIIMKDQDQYTCNKNRRKAAQWAKNCCPTYRPTNTLCVCRRGFFCNKESKCVHIKDVVLTTRGIPSDVLIGTCPVWHVCRNCTINNDCPSAGIRGVCATCVKKACSYNVCL